MDPHFVQAWDAAGHNIYWWASNAGGIFLVFITFVLSLCSKRLTLRRFLFVVIFILAFLWVANYTVVSIQEKWDLRYLAARTPEEKTLVSDRDTANLMMAPFIGCFWGLVYSGAALVSYLAARPLRRKRMPEALE